MDVSEDSGTPKSSILIGFSIINHPFWGTAIFGNIHISFHKCFCVNDLPLPPHFPMFFFWKDDPFFAELTVYETLCFASRLVGQSNQHAQQEAILGGTTSQPVRCFGCFFFATEVRHETSDFWLKSARIHQITCFFLFRLYCNKPFSSGFLVAVFVSECKSFIVSHLVCSFIQTLKGSTFESVFISTSKRPGFFLSKASLLVLPELTFMFEGQPLKTRPNFQAKQRAPFGF